MAKGTGGRWRRADPDAEFRTELETHLELLADRYRRTGMAPDRALDAARRQLGNVTKLRADLRDMRRRYWGEAIMQDVRDALRQLRRAPGFSLLAAATLALGIGGTTAVFSVVRGVLLAPLPYEAPGQLVRLYQQEPANPASRYFLTGAHFSALRDHAASFADLTAVNTYSETGVDFVADGLARRLRTLEVTSGYFRTLRAGPMNGPAFDLADETGTRRVVLSDALWRASFGADASVIGTTIRLSGLPYEVAGVAPPEFRDPVAGDIDAWVPYDLSGNTNEQNYSLTAMARLRNGVTPLQAQAELDALSRSLREKWPAARRSALVAVPLRDDMVASARGPLQLVSIAAALMLLIACVNVANLALVRATGRVQEFAVRAALGSGRARLIRLLLVESAALGLAGGALGVGLAHAGTAILRRAGGGAMPRLDAVNLDATGLAFAAVVSLATAIAAGVVPALPLAAVPPQQGLREASRGATASRGLQRLRNALAASQIAMALTLLVGAGVLLASFYRLSRLDLGVRVNRVLTFEVNLPAARYDPGRRAAFHEVLARELEAVAGVSAAGATSRLPATGSYHPWGTRIESGPLAGQVVSRALGFNIQQRVVSGRFFDALGIPLLVGRFFDGRDDVAAPGRALVSASFARQAFPGLPFEAVLGQRIAPLGQRREIVGVVGDVALDVFGAPSLTVYHAHRQFAANRNWTLSQVVAGELPPERLLTAVRELVTRLDPELVVHRAAPLAEVVGRGVGRQRFALVLMGAFATVSLLLAALGLYGVLACMVRQRTPELGVRIALGASSRQMQILVLRQAAFVLAAGLGVGLAGAFVLGRWLSALLFEVSPGDPRILLGTAVLLVLTTLVSAWLPARRAARVEPTTAMR